MYHHQDLHNKAIDLPAGKVVCVGRNYLDHIHELNNTIPEQAIFFIKPSTALAPFERVISIPQGECHNELEIAVLIQSTVSKCAETEILDKLWGIGLGLDLTLRDVQSELKKQGYPWERAKAFDGSAPMGRFIPLEEFTSLQGIEFELKVNDETRQLGNSELMMRSTVSLISEISQTFTLLPGDIVMTGTPKGVGKLSSGDVLTATLADKLTERAEVTINE